MPKSLLVLASFSICLWITPLLATHPEHRTFSKAEEFLDGEFTGVSLSSVGKLFLAPALTESLDTSEAFVHAAVANRAGALFFGTGNNGKIFRVDPAGQSSEFAKLDEPAVYALTVDSQGRLYAGTSPDGKVYRLDGSGSAETFFEPGEKFIWALESDDAGNIYVATGPQGKIFKVSSSGEGSVLYDSRETHIVSLARDLDQNLLAGTAPNGLLIRISPSGNPFVLLDSELEEIKTLATDRYGFVYAAALSGGTNRSESSTSSVSGSSSSTEESTVEVAGNPAEGSQLRLYRVDKQNVAEILYSSNDELAFDLLVRNDGSILMATGNKGRIISLSTEGFSSLLVQTPEEQATQLLEREGGLIVATSNLGKIYEVRSERSTAGTYESPVVDAEMAAVWGTLRWQVDQPSSAQRIQLYTRFGNTETPDNTWTDWSGPYSNADGSNLESETSRYLQWKVEFAPEVRSASLTSQADAIRNVSVSYMQKNAPPRISSLTVHAPGVAFARTPGNPSGGIQPGGPGGAHARSLPRAIRELDTPKVTAPSRKVYIPGARSFSWQASDPNDDSLTYTLHLRAERETSWRLLVEDLTEAEYTMDGASYPDGTYQLRVTASDKLSNPAGLNLAHELVTKSFVIANSSPAVEWQPVRVEGQTARIRFTALAPVSPLYQVEYSLDGRNWSVIFPQDGVTDEQSEEFELELEGLQAGSSQRLSIRVVDLVGNLGSSVRTFSVSR